MSDHVEIPTAKAQAPILDILACANKPKPIQEIADEIKKSYDDTKRYVEQMAKLYSIRFIKIPETPELPQGREAVELLTGPHNARFR